MICSLNEIEAEIRKAARGAGLPWGLAEEAGKAARWLEMHGMRGAPLFAALFESYGGRLYEAIAMVSGEGLWRARGGMLCPLVAGVGLSDRAHEIAAGRTIDMEAVSWPVLLAPFAAALSSATGAAIALRWPGVGFAFARDGVRLAADHGAMNAALAPRASCGPMTGDPRGRRLTPEIANMPVEEAAWSRLETFVQRTYVPASDESRLKGAGAGLLDTD